MGKITAFGEYLMRLSPPGGKRLKNTDIFEAYYGGSEMNALSLCALCGDETRYITALPDHDIGYAALSRLKALDIDTSYVRMEGSRIGIYFCDCGSSDRPTKVVYDRADSSFAQAKADGYDFVSAMKDTDWFHFSGITPALSQETLKATIDACEAAKAIGATISCDLNYRGKLWSMEEARKVMVPLMKYVDVCIANEADVYGCLGIETEGRAIRDVLYEITDRFGFSSAASMDIQNHSASHNTWHGVFLYEGKIYESAEANVLPITDRIGAGDAMAGGLIHALHKWNDPAKAIAFSTAAATIKSTVSGDYSCTDENELLTIVNKGTAAIQR